MFSRWKKFLAKHQTVPEESIPYRAAVTVLVMFALTLTLEQLEWPSYWPAILIITPVASVISYYRRGEKNVGIKIFLSFAMVALLLWFFVRLARTAYDPRLPLAELLIWLQTLHAFDLPAKKDLRYTGLVALILMAIACVLTYSSYFAPLLLLFCLLFLAVLAVDFWSGNRTLNTKVHLAGSGKTSLDFKWLGRTIAVMLPLSLLGAALIFLFMPRYEGLRLRSLPVSWDIQFSLGEVSGGEIMNPGSSRSEEDSGGKPQRIEGDSYFGFDSEVNLNSRGQLSDRVVVKVRSSNWQYHRGVTFSEYTGFGWKSIPCEPVTREITRPPFFFPSVNSNEDRVTIYYAETDLPNIVFTPPNPRRLYFPSNTLYAVDSFEDDLVPRAPRNTPREERVRNTPATLVSPFYLETGIVYSVLNQQQESGTSVLSQQRFGPEEEPTPPYLAPFLELPEKVSQRTKDKALELTLGQASPWGKASALTAYLQQNFTYDLNVDFYPEGVDTTDYFLFESKVGYCEQFATALCVMARSVGLPARYVTGYLPGTYNPVSGFYEIKASDAHAWAEIYLGEYGWIIFDPVPGGNPNPQIGDPPQNRWLLESLLEYWEVPLGIREALPDLLRLFVGLALVTLFLTLLRGRMKKTGPQASPFAAHLRQAERITEKRRPGETVRQWADRMEQFPGLQEIARIYEERFYRDLPLEEAQALQLRKVIKQLKKDAKSKKSKG